MGYLFFIYDSPNFITTTTTILRSQLTFLNPAGATTTSIIFIPDSTTYPETSELDVLNRHRPSQKILLLSGRHVHAVQRDIR
jgi:hypothetical protein